MKSYIWPSPCLPGAVTQAKALPWIILRRACGRQHENNNPNVNQQPGIHKAARQGECAWEWGRRNGSHQAAWAGLHSPEQGRASGYPSQRSSCSNKSGLRCVCVCARALSGCQYNGASSYGSPMFSNIVKFTLLHYTSDVKFIS